MASVNTLIRKGYLLAGVMMAANMCIVNEVKATAAEVKDITGQTPKHNSIFNFNVKELNSSFKKKLDNNKGLSGNMVNLKCNFTISPSKDITFRKNFTFSLDDSSTLCYGDNAELKKNIVDLRKFKLKDVFQSVIAGGLKFSIYGYEITHELSPLSAKPEGYRISLFSVNNVLNVLNRLSCTSFNFGWIDFLNLSFMTSTPYATYCKYEDKDWLFSNKGGIKETALIIDILSLNKNFSDCFGMSFLLGTHYNFSDVATLLDFNKHLKNFSMQLSLNYSCKYIFLNFKAIFYMANNSIMNDHNGKVYLNSYLKYSCEISNGGFILPVRMEIGSNALKGRKIASWGKYSLIFQDICLDIKTDIYANKGVNNCLLSYDLSLTSSLEKCITFVAGFCSYEKGLLLIGEENEKLVLISNKNEKYSDDGNLRKNKWIYCPTPYLKIQVDWLEVLK